MLPMWFLNSSIAQVEIFQSEHLHNFTNFKQEMFDGRPYPNRSHL